MIPKRRLLDARPRSAALSDPIFDSVNIPFEQLPDRTHELPPPYEEILVASAGNESRLAVEWLRSHGRLAALGEPAFGLSEPEGRLWSPNSFLEEIAPGLTAASALDIGCGTGRDAVYLASLGWRVLGIDVLPDALSRASALAGGYPLLADIVSWRALDAGSSLPIDGKFDLIAMFYFLDRKAIGRAISNLKLGGSILIETFTEVHRERYGKPRSVDRVLRSGELPDLVRDLEVKQFSENWRENGRHTARIWAVKSAS